jgi:hypothetical protein
LGKITKKEDNRAAQRILDSNKHIQKTIKISHNFEYEEAN